MLRQAELEDDTKKSNIDLPRPSIAGAAFSSDIEGGEVDENGGNSDHDQAAVSPAEHEPVCTRSIFRYAI